MREYLRQLGGFERDVRLLIIATLLINVGIGFFGVLFNLYLASVGKSLTFLGTLSAANTLAAAAGSLATRPLLHRYDARWVMTFGIVVFGLAALLETYLTPDWVLLGLTMFAGIGISLATAPSSPYLAENSAPAQRGQIFSVFFAVQTAGITIGSFACGILSLLVVGRFAGFGASSVSTYRLNLTVACVLILLSVLAYARLSPGRLGARISRVPEVETPPRANSSRDIAAMLVAVAALATSFGLIVPFFNLYFAEVAHATPSEIGFIFSLTSILTTVATLSSATLGQGLGRLLAFNAARVTAAVCLFLFALGPSLLVAAFIYIIWNIMLNVSGAIDYNFVMELLPAARRQSAAAFRVAIFNLGWATTSLGAGKLIQTHGYPPAFLLAGAGTLLCAAVYFGYFHLSGYREPRGWFLDTFRQARPRVHPRRSR